MGDFGFGDEIKSWKPSIAVLERSCLGTITKASCYPIFILFLSGFCILFCWFLHIILLIESEYKKPSCYCWDWDCFHASTIWVMLWFSSSLITHEVKLHLLTQWFMFMSYFYGCYFCCDFPLFLLTVHGARQVVHFNLGLLWSVILRWSCLDYHHFLKSGILKDVHNWYILTRVDSGNSL